MAVFGRAAVSRNVFDNWEHAAAHVPPRHFARQDGNAFRRVAIGAITDNSVRTRNRNVQYGRTIGINAKFRELGCNEAGNLKGRAFCGFWIVGIKIGVRLSRRQFASQGRAQTLNPATFLIDEHQ